MSMFCEDNSLFYQTVCTQTSNWNFPDLTNSKYVLEILQLYFTIRFGSFLEQILHASQPLCVIIATPTNKDKLIMLNMHKFIQIKCYFWWYFIIFQSQNKVSKVPHAVYLAMFSCVIIFDGYFFFWQNTVLSIWYMIFFPLECQAPSITDCNVEFYWMNVSLNKIVKWYWYLIKWYICLITLVEY